jgi:hypothetical protein
MVAVVQERVLDYPVLMGRTPCYMIGFSSSYRDGESFFSSSYRDGESFPDWVDGETGLTGTGWCESDLHRFYASEFNMETIEDISGKQVYP